MHLEIKQNKNTGIKLI